MKKYQVHDKIGLYLFGKVLPGDEMQTVFIILIIFSAAAVIPVTAIVTNFMLKKEKIKAEAMIKAEEIQAKNRLDIELLLHKNKMIDNPENLRFNDTLDYGNDERRVREKKI